MKKGIREVNDLEQLPIEQEPREGKDGAQKQGGEGDHERPNGRKVLGRSAEHHGEDTAEDAAGLLIKRRGVFNENGDDREDGGEAHQNFASRFFVHKSMILPLCLLSNYTLVPARGQYRFFQKRLSLLKKIFSLRSGQAKIWAV
jgi:hypothetical protein